jgi:hypothetical protein
MSNRLRPTLSSALFIATFAFSVSAASAWGLKGHTIVNHLAAVSLPASVPAFMRTPGAIAELSNLGTYLDLQKGAGIAWDAAYDPGHYLDLEGDDTVGGIPLRALPPTREAYDTALRAHGTDQYKMGYVPYSILEGWQQLRMDFAYWRVDDYEAAHGPSSTRAKARAAARVDEALVLRDAGVWGHYVADASQPLHITVHFNGWGDYPNPNGYSNSPHFHDLFESDFVERFITEAGVATRLAPLHVPHDARLAGDRQVLTSIETYLAGSNAMVEPLYRIAKAGGFAHASPESSAFAEGRLAYGASELRDLIVWAWQDSLNETIGDDAPQAVRAVVSGRAPYRGRYF